MSVMSFLSVNMPVSKSFSANQGLIDLEKEVTKLTAKKGELEKQMEKMKEKMAKNDYKEKVPVKVQEADAEKVSGKEMWEMVLNYSFLQLLVLKKSATYCFLSS